MALQKDSTKYDSFIDEISEGCAEFAKEFFQFVFREDQRQLAWHIFYRMLLQKRHTINVSFCRQVGKTEVIVICLMYILLFFHKLIGERIRICVCAPEKGTSTEFFDRIKVVSGALGIKTDQSNADLILFPHGSRVDKFGLFKGYAKIEDKKSTREGRTFHLVIRDEKHMGDDSVYDDEIVPALSTTGGLEILIGNGGFKNCKAKRISDMFPDKTKLVQKIDDITNIEADYNIMKPIMQKAYEETDNEMFLRWVDSQDAYIKEHGMDDHFVQKNLFNKWLTDSSNFIDIHRLQKLARDESTPLYSTIIHLGLDLAKSQDETVLTFTDENGNVRDWQIFRGEYTDQVQDIHDALLEFNKEKQYHYEYLFVDSTGVGDPIRAMLKQKIEHIVVVRGITFTTKEKDKMARKFISAIQKQEFSYPKDHKLTPKFEKQMVELVKEYRDDGKINCHHPNTHGAKDDFYDSTVLSLYKIQSVGDTRAYETNTIDV